jgi:3-deoxy-D-manno-octulosonic-acid transferase
MGIDRSRPLIVGGSTEPGEPELLRAATPGGAQLLCAPRKTDWFDGCAAALSLCVRRSAGQPGDRADRFVLDTIGELRKAYALADVIVIGRSFGELFGSDPMEAAALGKPIVIGPRVADFRAAVEALEHAGAIVRATRESLAADLRGLLNDEPRRRELSARALACVRANLGAAERHERLIREMMAIPHGPAAVATGARAE